MAVPPACLMPQDGHDKQDGERVAGKRWMDKHAQPVAPDGVTWLGEELSRNQPLGKFARQNGWNFMCVCTPDAHATLYACVAFWQATDASNALETRRKHGRITAITRYRYMTEVFLRGGPGSWAVKWLESTSVQATTGAPLSHHSFLTQHRLSADHGSQVAQAGRGRWTVEHENHHVRKTKGYHLEHHFGHGKRSLAALLLSRNLLAFLCQTVLQWCEAKYALLRQVVGQTPDLFRGYARLDALYGV
jgi:hypothetical protein